MRLSTSVNLYSVRREGNLPQLMLSGVGALKRAGFDAIDFSITTPLDLPLSAQEIWITRANEEMTLHGIRATQGHAYLTNTRLLTDDGALKNYIEKVKRSLVIAGQLGIPWMVVHPVCFSQIDGSDLTRSVSRNVPLLRALESVMAASRVGVALENLPRSEFHSAEALLTLQKALDNDDFGFCWDTGHAYLSKEDQPAAIAALGDKLRCTHIQDNHGESDEHLFPMMGSIPWPPIVRALKRSGYRGDFTYETAQPVKFLPSDDILRKQMLRYAVDLGRYLLSMGEENT